MIQKGILNRYVFILNYKLFLFVCFKCSYESMKNLVDKYNRAIDTILQLVSFLFNQFLQSEN